MLSSLALACKKLPHFHQCSLVDDGWCFAPSLNTKTEAHTKKIRNQKDQVSTESILSLCTPTQMNLWVCIAKVAPLALRVVFEQFVAPWKSIYYDISPRNPTVIFWKNVEDLDPPNTPLKVVKTCQSPKIMYYNTTFFRGSRRVWFLSPQSQASLIVGNSAPSMRSTARTAKVRGRDRGASMGAPSTLFLLGNG